MPTSVGKAIEFESSQGRYWEHVPGSPPPELRTRSLWESLEQDDSNRKQIVLDAGARLADWLFDQRAEDALTELVHGWSVGSDPLRVELSVPRDWTEWPWEIVQLEGLGPLAVHDALTFVRISRRTAPKPRPRSQLSIDLVGVELDELAGLAPLETGKEIEIIRQEIQTLSSKDYFSVQLDASGSWSGLVERYQNAGPPQVFHFAGHGLEEGKGLVLRADNGTGREVNADELAALLAQTGAGGRRTQLIFLNACNAAAAAEGPYQPFGSLSDMLIQRGIPAVVGFQAPLDDLQAREVAALFYKEIGSGSAVDRALQQARRANFLRTSRGVTWAFATLTVSGVPQALLAPSEYSVGGPSATIYEFAHRSQRERLRLFLRRQDPMVAIIHGEDGRGHRYVAERVQNDLESARVLWRWLLNVAVCELGRV